MNVESLFCVYVCVNIIQNNNPPLNGMLHIAHIPLPREERNMLASMEERLPKGTSETYRFAAGSGPQYIIWACERIAALLLHSSSVFSCLAASGWLTVSAC